jgi:hypothetical protein
MTSSSTSEAVRDILASRQLSRFIGMGEGLHLEVKGRVPYDLETANAQYELAKDVSALANAGGGWIVCGLTTKEASDERKDIISALDLVSRSDFPDKRFDGLVREYVKPFPMGFEVTFIASEDDPDKGVGVLHVPQQSEDQKPFLIAKVVDDSTRIKQIVFGYARRIGEDAEPHNVQQLREALRTGMSPTAQRLSSIEEQIGIVLERMTGNGSIANADESVAHAATVLNERFAALFAS